MEDEVSGFGLGCIAIVAERRDERLDRFLAEPSCVQPSVV
jgi:hypothetical protein